MAPNDNLLVVDPTWTRLDTLGGGLRVAEIAIRRGRQDEFDDHQTGTMSVSIRDREGDADPTLVDWTSCPMAFAVRNPVTDEWQPRFRGAVDDHGYDLHPSSVKGDVQIECVDALDYFANAELAPGDGDPGPEAGFIFYEDTAVTGPQIRINTVLDDVGWPSGLSSIFTGNVNLLESTYSSGDSAGAVIKDAVDAELPGIGQWYIDRYGVASFHGRNARFDPATTAATATHWDYHEFDVGVGGVQHRNPFVVSRSRRMIRNRATCWPMGLPTSDREFQTSEDATSISRHGIRAWSASDLIVKDGITTGLDGFEECQAFNQYILDNYANSSVRIDQITFKAIRPEDVRGPDLWELLTEIDLSDSITITRPFPGGGGFTSETYFVEGISETWRPLVKDLDTGYPFVEMTLDLSPATYWSTEVGG